MNYHDMLLRKQIRHSPSGFECGKLNGGLFEWQSSVTRWALRQGRAALFEDCGLGKTAQQLVWADAVARHTDLPVLILAPLSVSVQTMREGLMMKHIAAAWDVKPEEVFGAGGTV